MVINEYLVKDLINMNIWNETIKDKIILNDGSIQKISEIPKFIKDLYKTAWELKQKYMVVDKV
mgnify:CR=1 FL=1